MAEAVFRARTVEALEAIDVVNGYNFDLRNITHEDGLRCLKTTLSVCAAAKKKLLRTRKALDDLIFNLDYFIARNSQDVKKVQGRIDGEAPEA